MSIADDDLAVEEIEELYVRMGIRTRRTENVREPKRRQKRRSEYDQKTVFMAKGEPAAALADQFCRQLDALHQELMSSLRYDGSFRSGEDMRKLANELRKTKPAYAGLPYDAVEHVAHALVQQSVSYQNGRDIFNSREPMQAARQPYFNLRFRDAHIGIARNRLLTEEVALYEPGPSQKWQEHLPRTTAPFPIVLPALGHVKFDATEPLTRFLANRLGFQLRQVHLYRPGDNPKRRWHMELSFRRLSGAEQREARRALRTASGFTSEEIADAVFQLFEADLPVLECETGWGDADLAMVSADVLRGLAARGINLDARELARHMRQADRGGPQRIWHPGRRLWVSVYLRSQAFAPEG